MGKFLFGVLCGLGLAAYVQHEKEKTKKELKKGDAPTQPAEAAAS